jgi:hypothetical protein
MPLDEDGLDRTITYCFYYISISRLDDFGLSRKPIDAFGEDGHEQAIPREGAA